MVVFPLSCHLYLNAEELVVSVALCTSLHTCIKAPPSISLAHNGKSNAVQFLHLGVFPGLLVDVFFAVPCVAQRCLIDGSEIQKFSSRLIHLPQSMWAANTCPHISFTLPGTNTSIEVSHDNIALTWWYGIQSQLHFILELLFVCSAC